MVRTAVMCSGSGTNLQALLDAEARGELCAEIAAVISNRRTAFALERAAAAGKDAVWLSPSKFEDEAHYSRVLMDVLSNHDVSLICLAGYLRKLPAAVITAFRGRILNIHPAPLPRFGGPGMYGHHVHEAVLAAGVDRSGPTVHFVDEEYDHGPIIAHLPVPVYPDDTPDSLAMRVLMAEHQLYPRVVSAVARGQIQLREGKIIGNLDA